MTKRLFIAIPVPEEIKRELARYKKYFQTGNIRWIPEENWHITILFLGDTPEEKIFILKEHLSKVCENTVRFNLVLQNVVVGPPNKNPRMIWAIFRRQREFEQLVKKVKNALADLLPIDYSHQERIAHITLARFPAWFSDRRQAPEVKNISLKVKEILLMESKLTSEGAIYKILGIYNL